MGRSLSLLDMSQFVRLGRLHLRLKELEFCPLNRHLHLLLLFPQQVL
jgi:hypothetical protein